MNDSLGARSRQCFICVIVTLLVFQCSIFAQSKVEKIDRLIQAYHEMKLFSGSALVMVMVG